MELQNRRGVNAMNELAQDKLYDVGGVKRADVNLRTKYYGLKTRIFLIERHHYVIQILNYMEMYEQIKEDFDNNIRRLGDWVELIKENPTKMIMEVEQLTNIASNHEGVFLTHQMFESLLVSKFPNVTITSTKVEHLNGVILKITVDINTTDKEIDAMKQFIVNMRNGFTEIVVEKNNSTKKSLYDNDIGLACTDKNYKFSVDDSEFWFGNVEGIYAGKIKQDALRFYDPNKTKCYLDFSVWDNQNINIRSNILLYDKVYISFPLAGQLENFLNKQNLSLQDMEELVARGKLIILLPNTEQRYDSTVVNRLYQINNNCIVSKRGINALMAISYCDLEQKYLSFWKDNEAVLETLCMECMKTKDIKMKRLLQWLLWPINAKLESYELLNSYGPMKLPSIGVNTLLENFFDGTEQGDAVQFELVANSSPIHIASALKATYFPFQMGYDSGKYSDYSVANILGGIINSYQYTPQNQKDYIAEYTTLLNKERNAVYLLSTENSVGIKHFLDYTERYKTTCTLKNILGNLIDMSETDRRNRITEYNNLIAEVGKEKLNPGKTVIDYLLTGAGFVPGIGTVASVISLIIQIFDSIGLEGRVAKHKIKNNKASVKEEVYLLDRLSRVAKIVPRNFE